MYKFFKVGENTFFTADEFIGRPAAADDALMAANDFINGRPAAADDFIGRPTADDGFFLIPGLGEDQILFSYRFL